MKRNRIRILGIPVDMLTPKDVMDSVDSAVTSSTPSVYAYTNIHTINEAAHNQLLRSFLESSNLNILDGKGVKLGAWLLGKDTGQALGITRLIWDVLAHCEKKNLSIFLLGSTDEHILLAAEKIRLKYPALVIAGIHHGYFAKEGKESAGVLQRIAEARPAIVFAGFGTPLQEEWVTRNRTTLTAPVTMLVGGCFDIIAGKRHASPLWIAHVGLEWLYRLAQEPFRLWQRYLIGIPIFMGRIAADRIRGLLHIPPIPRKSVPDAID